MKLSLSLSFGNFSRWLAALRACHQINPAARAGGDAQHSLLRCTTLARRAALRILPARATRARGEQRSALVRAAARALARAPAPPRGPNNARV
eukprot:COSAG02_NODE_6392_length_3602_cov_38.216386_3_plen_93_part_00